jgi:hypothetical protein
MEAPYIQIQFQEGPLQEAGVNGTTIEAVIEVLLERLRALNHPPLNCRENSLAITALEDAQNWLYRRTRNRIEQEVEGSRQPHRS